MLFRRPDFNSNDVKDVDFVALDRELASSDVPDAPWARDGEGWRHTPLVIGIPTGQKSTQASRRAAATAQARMQRHETIADEPAEQHFQGHPFTVDGLWHKSLTTEIKTTLETDPAAARFIYDPSLILHVKPDGQYESVYGELLPAHW